MGTSDELTDPQGRAGFGPTGAARAVSSTPPAPVMPARYEDLGRIARGGWGEVRRVRDRVMERVVVMKILAAEHLLIEPARRRFLNEARITASLEHPGIVPVHDAGTLDDGRPWFCMKEVRGTTLAALILAEGRDREKEGQAELRRFIEMLVRVCEPVAYAHEREIIHRDLKPQNIMTGEFGEVLVLDWGIARALSDREDETPSVPPRTSDTSTGDVLGTAAYMAPEQALAQGARLGPHTDVFSLGLILYEILTGRRARHEAYVAAWASAANGEVPVIEDDRAGGVPEELREICERATRTDVNARYRNAGELAAALRAWLDGSARRARADLAVAAAAASVETIDALRLERDALVEDAAQMLARVRDFDPVEAKLPAWRLQDQANELESRIGALEANRVEMLRTALQHDASHAPAHAALALVYRKRLLDAERRGAHADVVRCELLLRRHDRGEHAAVLAGVGKLELESERDATCVRVSRYALRDRRLVPELVHADLRTPISITLQAGSYLVELLREDGRWIRYPVIIGRNEAWDRTRPGAASPSPVRVDVQLGPEDIFVPGGWTTVGDDPLAPEPVPTRRVWIDDFVMSRFPVTCAEYLAFLDDVAERRGTDAALEVAPKLAPGTAERELPAVSIDAQGRFSMLPAEQGVPVEPSWPVTMVDWRSADAYARWRAERTGLPWRLADELEWEKAARGVDRRPFVWGAQPEATWARLVGSSETAPRRAPVDSFPIDESPYGVRGMVGNVRDWCLGIWQHSGPRVDGDVLRIEAPAPDAEGLRAIRGGAWSSPPALARAAGRPAARIDERFAVVGFRLARSV